jgi:hypothetical protein
MSRCQFKKSGGESGRFLYRCSVCEREVSSKQAKPPSAICRTSSLHAANKLPPLVPPPPPKHGVGSELAALFAEYGIVKRSGCGCNDWIGRMNAWGPSGCGEHREEILAHLRKSYDLTTFWERARAAAVAWLNGLPTSLPAVLDEASRRAIAQAHRAVRDANEYLGGNDG